VHCNMKTLTLLFGLVFLIDSGEIFAQRMEIPSSVFYYQPAASVFGSEAAWVNPAGLARYSAASLQLIAGLHDDTQARSWGLVTTRDRLAMAYRNVYMPDGDDLKEYLFALGTTLGDGTHVGGSYRYFKEGPPELHKGHTWNVGILGGRDKLRWAAVFENLNRSKNSEGNRTETEMRYSIGYRPIGHRFTFSVDMFLSTGTRLPNADYVYHAELASNNGLYLRGQIDSDKNFQIGLRANLLEYFVGSQTHYSSGGDHLNSDVYAGSTSKRQRSIIGPRGRRLALGLSGRMPENPPRPFFGHKPTPFAVLITNIYRAAEDPSIDEMLISLRGLSLGFAQAQELWAALIEFKRGGKLITCHLSRAGNIAYYVASAADRILMTPVDRLRLVGMKAELTFYAGSLDKIGIKADVMQVGDHKSAAEKFTRSEASDANRVQVNRLLDDLFDQLVSTIAAGRSLSADSVRSLIDQGPFDSEQALEYGLVDALSYHDDLHHGILSPMPQVSFKRYLSDTLLNDGWPPLPVMAVVVADGEITSSGSPNPFQRRRGVTPSLMNLGFAQALQHPKVAGVVLRINSPGGFALAGEEIHHIAEKAARKKPLVVSMANVAASGGYYIAMNSRRIYAGPGSITGSIGIFGGKPDFSGLYDKIDLGTEMYTRGRYAGMLSTMRGFTDDERLKYFSQMQAFYDHFLKLVADNRTLEVDSIDALAQGRVWTGREAAKYGLVDEMGGLKQALDYTASQLRVSDYRVALFPERRSWFALPGRSLFGMVAGLFSGNVDVVDKALENVPPLTEEGIYARMPYDLIIE